MTVYTERHLALYEILLDGAPIDPTLARGIREIRVSDYMHLPDLCTFTIGFDTTTTDPPPIDRQPFTIGAKIEVRLGARATTSVKSVFTGEIVTLLPRFSAGGAELTVRAFDRSHRLHRSRRVRTFQNQTASDIVETIAGEAGLTPETEASGAPFEFMQQNNETDLDFINRLAQRIGFEFTVDDATAHFRPIGAATPVPLQWPRELQSFTPRLTAVQQVERVTVSSYDPLSAEVVNTDANVPNQTARTGIERDAVVGAFPGDVAHVVTEPAQSPEEAQQLAQALLDRLANAYVTAEGAGDGNPLVRAGTTVQVDGIGASFGGTYRVQSSTHTFSGGSTYRMEFASTAIQTIAGAVAASRPADFAAQLVIGIVTNNQDPEGLGRVRVKYPVLGDDHEGWWARIATTAAGNERGLLMLPVPGEEVLVGFEHDDTTRPLILGSLFNGRDVPGPELAQEDGSFGLRSDEHVIMRAGKGMQISAGGTLTVEISGDAKLTYESNVDESVGQAFTQSAGTNWSVDATANADLTAGAKLTISGATIAIKSDGPLQIEGNPVDIKSSSAINISGPMVNLG